MWQRTRDQIVGGAATPWLGRLRLRWVFGSLGAIAAAAVLVVLVRLAVPGGGDMAGQRLMGSAAPALTTLVVGAPATTRFADGATVALRYGLERAAWLRLLHWQPQSAPATLFDDRAAAASDGQGVFQIDQGTLGYRFEQEPGPHLFVLLSSEVRLSEAQVAALLDDRWFERPEPWHVVAGQEPEIGVRMVRVHVE
jgi:hypothetical protein